MAQSNYATLTDTAQPSLTVGILSSLEIEWRFQKQTEALPMG